MYYFVKKLAKNDVFVTKKYSEKVGGPSGPKLATNDVFVTKKSSEKVGGTSGLKIFEGKIQKKCFQHIFGHFFKKKA